MMIRTLLLQAVAAAGTGLLAMPAFAADRFEVLDGELIDHHTGLIWRSLSASAGVALPLSPIQGEYRVASSAELFAVLPLTGGAPMALSTGADVYAALSFFAQTALPAGACLLPIAGSSCVGGWWYDGQLGGQATYNIASFLYGPAGAGNVSYTSLSTTGNYTSNNCPLPACNVSVGLFEVRAVPELPTLAMLLAGLALMRLRVGAGVRADGDAHASR